MTDDNMYLGKPCKRGHVTAEGLTVRRKDNGSCPECTSVVRKANFKAVRAACGGKYEGAPCLRGHLTPSGKTLRWANGGMCVLCSKDHKRAYHQSAKGRVVVRESHWRLRGLPTPTRQRPEVCELCGEVNQANKVLVNDHCHKTGAFRGWLCTSCNSALGHLGDSLEGVLRAAEYLRKNSPAV